MYKLLFLFLIIFFFFRKQRKEHFIRGLPAKSSKFKRDYKIKLTDYDPHKRGYIKKETESEKLMKKYLNDISEPVSHNANVLPSSVFFGKGQKYFSQDISLPMITDKYNNLNENLKKLKDKESEIKKIESNERLIFTKKNAINLAKHFITKYNNKSSLKVDFVKILDFYKKQLINKEHIRYVISLFIKIPKYRHVFQILIVSEIPKKEEIIFQNKNDEKHHVHILKNIVLSHLLGSWTHSDILFGSHNNFNTEKFKYQIDFKGPKSHLFIKNIKSTDKIVNDKIKKNSTSRLSIYSIKHLKPKLQIPKKEEYHQYDFTEGLIKVGDKCIDKYIGKNKWILNDCAKAKQIFKMDNDEYKIDDINSLSYHKDKEFSFGTYADKNICINSKKDITKNCKKLKFKKFGGIEIMGLGGKCLKPNSDNTWSSIDCKDAPISEFIKYRKEQKIKNGKKGKIQIGNKCLNSDNNSNWSLKDCNKVKELTHNNNSFTQDGKNCLTYHHKGKIGNSPCDGENYCKITDLSQNCKKFKFLNRNGIKIIGKNKCLNEKFEEVECVNAPIAKFITS